MFGNGNSSMPISKERLAEIEAIPDEDIDTSEIPEAGEAFFKNAKLVMPGDQQNPGRAPLPPTHEPGAFPSGSLPTPARGRSKETP